MCGLKRSSPQSGVAMIQGKPKELDEKAISPEKCAAVANKNLVNLHPSQVKCRKRHPMIPGKVYDLSCGSVLMMWRTLTWQAASSKVWQSCNSFRIFRCDAASAVFTTCF